MKIKEIIKEAINDKLRSRILRVYAKALRDKQLPPPPSLLCNNCVGAIILHDLRLPFCSPFVNLFIYPKDYIFLLENLHEMINADIKDVSDEYDTNYPVGLLGGKVKLHFMHYTTFNDARTAWLRRTKRIDFSNIRVMFVERDGTTVEDLMAFDNLPFKHKVAFTHKDYSQVKSSFRIDGCTEGSQLGHVFSYSGWNGRKYYDQFDIMNFLFGENDF